MTRKPYKDDNKTKMYVAAQRAYGDEYRRYRNKILNDGFYSCRQ